MGMKDRFIELSQSQVGVAEKGSTNIVKFSEYFDTIAWQWFNGKKNGIADWCAIYICWLFCQLLGADRARTFLGCPAPKDNCGAGVKFLWQYLTKRGWKVDKTQGQAGDIIFFNTKSSNCGHVGMIEAVANGQYHTIEGNKSNKVGRGVYSIKSASVYGVCRPNWAEIDVEPAPQPTPTPTPTPEPQGYTGEFPTLPSRGYFKKGDKGREVYKLQNLLLWISEGCLPKFGADSEYGNETYNAVKVCQSVLGVKVDGLWGKASQAKAKAYKK